MSKTTNGDRVTNKQLYDELTGLRNDLPSRREMYAAITVAVLGGNAVAALALKYTGAGPAVHTAVEHALRWL